VNQMIVLRTKCGKGFVNKVVALPRVFWICLPVEVLPLANGSSFLQYFLMPYVYA